METLLAQYAQTYRFRAGRPTACTFSPDGDAVWFLRSGPRDRRQGLYEFQIAQGQERAIVSAASVSGGADDLSPEALARLERQRVATRGFSAFTPLPDGRRILANLDQRLLLVERASGVFFDVLPEALHGALDVRPAPDGSRVALVHEGDLYVLPLDSTQPVRLTTTANAARQNGLADFLAQEEMHRMEGYWWSPDSTRLAYQETDDSEVEVRYLADGFHPTKTPKAWRYPRAGTTNPRVRLGVILAIGGVTQWIEWDQERFPYLATVKWSGPDSLLLVVQNRLQTEELILKANPRSGRTDLLFQESDAAWLNLDQSFPHPLSDGSFLWMTEREGERRLELRDAGGRPMRCLTPIGSGFRKLLCADESADVAWVIADPNPAMATLAAVALSEPGRIDPVADAIHPSDQSESVFSAKHQLMVHAQISDEAASRWPVRRWRGRTLGEEVGELSCVVERPREPLRRQILSVPASPELPLWASVIRPNHFQPGQRYPVIVYVYGGPGSQVVKVGRFSYPLDQWMANRGYVVVSVDGRGTPGRDRGFERSIKGDFASLPLEDQVRGLQALGRAFPELDLTRVGIFGWSFGGYLSAMAVMRRPDVFHAAVCGAPVPDFREYDTHYTERYLGLPATAPAAYEVSSLHTYAAALTRPLLLIHGTADDNCYFSGTLRFSQTLLRSGVPHEFLPLAGETHMVIEPWVVEKMYLRVGQFFDRHIPGEASTAER